MTENTTLKALVIDDDPEIRREITDILDEYGHEHDEAGNIKEARNKMLAGGYDYVLLDMELPMRYGGPLRREYGEDFLKELRAQYSANELPIIVVTGTVPDSEKAASLLYDGATSFVSKPISSGHPTLREAIQKFVIWRSARTAYQPEPPVVQEVRDTCAEYATDSTMHGWLQMQRQGYKLITWRSWTTGGTLHRVKDMPSDRIACKILKLLYKALPKATYLKDSDIMKAGGWTESEYYRTSKRGKMAAYNGIARNRLGEIKKELGIGFKFETGGITFFPPLS